MHKYEPVCIHGIERFLGILIISSGGQASLIFHPRRLL
jgi:hypothetical protein